MSVRLGIQVGSSLKGRGMQIPQTSWINPAAASAQAATQSRSDGAANSSASHSDALIVTDVESAQKTGDRDANEQYQAQEHLGASQKRSPKASSNDDVNNSYTDLPADDGESHELDCWG